MPKSQEIKKKKRKSRRQPVKPGLPPGTIVPAVLEAGEQKRAAISVMEFNSQGYQEFKELDSEKLKIDWSLSNISWVDVVGVQDVAVLKHLGELFDIHALILEDVANVTQRPKIDEYEDQLFVVIKMLHWNDDERPVLLTEQISMVLGKGFVVTFQEVAGDVFEPVRQRIRDGRGRIRSSGADYLWYALIDAIVDHYLLVVDDLDRQIESLEDELFTNPSKESLVIIDKMRKENILLRRLVRPLRDLFSSLMRLESSLIDPSTYMYLRDVHDHINSVYDAVETFRDMISSQVDHYMSSMSNRMNEIMKFLTVVGSVFIPLTFIAGLYGMNFQYMPELQWPMGYPLALTLMAIVGIVTLLFFRAKT